MIEKLKDIYKGHYLGDNEVVLTIYLTSPRAREFYEILTSVLQPMELKDLLTWDFVDESDAIVVKGSKEKLVQLKDFLILMENSFKVGEEVITKATESEFSMRKFLLEDFKDFNIYSCMKCKFIMVWDKYGFPLQRPLMCSQCGSYMFQKTS